MARTGMHSKSTPSPWLLLTAFLGFVSLGLPDTLVGIAWPSVRETFGRNQSAVAFIFIGTGASYFLSSFFTGRLVGVLGVGGLLAGSSTLVAISGCGYGLAPVWWAFVACSLLHGLGSGAIDAGLNHYVAHHFSARHMNWLHACYTFGATFGPLVMTAVLAAHGSWRVGYLVVAALLVPLSVVFIRTRSQWQSPETRNAERVDSVSMIQTLGHPLVWLQVVIFFFYTGLEATAGQWSFTLLTESRHLPRETAGLWVTIYWGSILTGRIAFGFMVDRLGIDRLLRSSTWMALGGTILLRWNPHPFVTFLALSGIGFSLSAIYPCLMTRTPQRLGRAMASHAIGFQVSAAISGGAALPSLSGLLAQRFGLEMIPLATMGMAAILCVLHELLLLMGSAKQPE